MRPTTAGARRCSSRPEAGSGLLSRIFSEVMLYSYSLHEAAECIDWLYFFHAWGFGRRFSGVSRIHDCPSCRNSWVGSFPAEERAKAGEAARLYDDARFLLDRLDETEIRIGGLAEIFPANSREDNIVFRIPPSGSGGRGGGEVLFPLLRQQRPAAGSDVCLCLSDFVRPEASGIEDRVGVFATAVRAEKALAGMCDVYQQLLLQTLCDRLSEACAELMHAAVRRVQWGYAPHERLTAEELLAGKYVGIRPAIGYPSLPDQSEAFLIDRLLGMGKIGVSLTETGAMQPAASTCGLMLGHPAARYFAVGKISDEQLHDYAARRGMPPDTLRRFLSGNL